jgi:phosphonate transport system substrate-binding protein
MAENAAATCREITEYLGARIGAPTQFVEGFEWQECEALLDRGTIHLCWICGLPYAWKMAMREPALEMCAVPVMREERYQKQPVYFSDIVVHRRSRFQSFAELRGAAWAYNEPRSHSGYNVVRHHLAALGEEHGYFGSVVESGAHQRSLAMIVNGEIDASAIDSTVLEAELRRTPALNDEIRIVETLGPSPMPPWVMHRGLAPELKDAIVGALLGMHADPDGSRVLAGWGISHFVRPDRHAYGSLIMMERKAAGVSLAQNATGSKVGAGQPAA